MPVETGKPAREPGLNFVRHRDDHVADEILICRPVPGRVVPDSYAEALEHAVLKVAIIERYKTSDLSGDEWRYGAGLWVRDPEWRLISNYIDFMTAPAFLYPELYGDFQKGKWPAEFISRQVGAVVFSWKGLPVYSASWDGKPTPLFVALAHLPFALLQAGDVGRDPKALDTLCCQPGCRAPHVSIYRLKKHYCREGHASELFDGDPPTVRGFCAKHLRRGDCALEDADGNYEVLSGPGPDGHEPPASVKTRSRTVVLEGGLE